MARKNENVVGRGKAFVDKLFAAFDVSEMQSLQSNLESLRTRLNEERDGIGNSYCQVNNNLAAHPNDVSLSKEQGDLRQQLQHLDDTRALAVSLLELVGFAFQFRSQLHGMTIALAPKPVEKPMKMVYESKEVPVTRTVLTAKMVPVT